ncbi:hypothetical protein Tco_1157634 [Tanacetum coccineum]
MGCLCQRRKLQQSKRETTVHQAGSSNEGADFESKVPDELKGKPTDTSKGTSLKPGVPDVSTMDSSKSENESWGDSDNEYVHAPKDYVPTNDEMNDESNDVIEEEYERINEELYGDVNVRLTNVEPDDEEKGDMEMTNVETEDAEHENVNQEGACNQVKDDAQATQKTEGPILSSSISFDYVAKYLNFDNIPPVDTEVVFMLDINVQHEVP